MRKTVWSILCIGIVCTALCISGAAFTDIEDETTELAVYTLESMGIVAGTSDTTYSPEQTLTRAQVCAMLIRAMGQTASVESYARQNLFSDVEADAWYAGYVNLAYRQGVINGYGNGCFGPNDKITYGQCITMFLRLLGYTDADAGKIWPQNYIGLAAELAVDEDVNLGADDFVTRGDAAILLYKVLLSKTNGSGTEYYRTLSGYAASVTGILSSISEKTTDDLLVYVLSNTEITTKYYTQKNAVPSSFSGCLGEILLDSADKVIGFIPTERTYTDIVVKSAKASGITDAAGNTYRIDSTACVIYASSVYTYGSTGYVRTNAHSGQNARLYYNDAGSVCYIYLAGGTDLSAKTAVASSDAPAAEFTQALDIPENNYTIIKNGGLTNTAALAMYDVAYYDSLTNTLHVSDYKLTGYIESASPAISAAETITISGCELRVLQDAWDTLEAYTLGSYVTVLLTASGEVAAACSPSEVSAEMYGVLSTDGSSITLCGSGLVIQSQNISAHQTLYGSLVQVRTSLQDTVKCSSLINTSMQSASVDLSNKAVGDIPLAAGCCIYEWGGSGYVYSLSGEQGQSSSDFAEIYWTDTLEESSVSYYHVNTAGLIDILLLSKVTGNYYDYGYVTVYTDAEGVSIGSAYLNGAVLENSENKNGSEKYVCTVTSADGYMGITLGGYNRNYIKVVSNSRLTLSQETSIADFYLTDDDTWYVRIDAYTIPVSDSVQVYVEATDQWISGSEGMSVTLSTEFPLQVYYDRTLTTGAQVRVIVLKTEEAK